MKSKQRKLYELRENQVRKILYFMWFFYCDFGRNFSKILFDFFSSILKKKWTKKST